MNDSTIYSEYCFNSTMDFNSSLKIKNGQGFRLVNDEWITQEEFKKRYPLKIRPRLRSLQNIDNTKKWML